MTNLFKNLNCIGEKLISQNNRLDISKLTMGMYIVRISNIDGKYHIDKLIVK